MDYMFDRNIICPWDKTATEKRIQQYEKYYAVKHRLCQQANPGTIVEIGVRAGYSACAFLQACPDAHYIGIDADNGKHGGAGEKPYIPWAEKVLSEKGYDFRIAYPVDTQNLDSMPSADFYHIDGDHTAEGCMHDLDICYSSANPGAVLLIDDYDYIKTVKDGVDRWLSENPDVAWQYVPSLRGEILITKATPQVELKEWIDRFGMRSLSPSDLMYKRWLEKGVFYEKKLLNKIRTMKKEGVYLDIGANLGNHSVYMANYCPAKKVIAVEASPDIARVLRVNLRSNVASGKYRVVNKAVTAKSGTYTPSDIDMKNVGSTSVSEGGLLESITVDDITDGIRERIAVMKIDVEGFEAGVIEGAFCTIKRDKPVITAELDTAEKYSHFEQILRLCCCYTCDKVNYAITPTYIWTPVQ